MNLLKEYKQKEQEIHDYFGYKEDWEVIPLQDNTNFFWYLNDVDDQAGHVYFAETKEQLEDLEAGNFYQDELYKQIFLPKWAFRGKDYTMITSYTGVDGNKFLRIFDNAKEIQRATNKYEIH